MNNDERYWKKKIAAFLHDTPEKQFDIANHEEFSKKYFERAGIDWNLKSEIAYTDRFHSSLERFAFPKVKCSHNFVEEPNFIHPFSGAKYNFIKESFSTTERRAYLEERINAVSNIFGSNDYKTIFFNLWRRWQENCITYTDGNVDLESLGFLPADSRIPDHSIWTHMSMSSAFVDCANESIGDLVLFQFGPVQDFIAQARSTRDLWSGSYLLSWLSAHAMKAITDERGPDAIVFPSLRGNGIFDALHNNSIYRAEFTNANGEKDTLWERICEEKGEKLKEWLLNPTLPNRFLAIVPQGTGHEYARKAQKALQEELNNIANDSWGWIEWALEILNTRDKKYSWTSEEIMSWRERFYNQVSNFPQITYAVQPWLSQDDLFKELEVYSPATKENIENFVQAAENKIPATDKDPRYFDSNTGKLNNGAFLWSGHIALVNAKLAARKNTRDFVQYDSNSGYGLVKDSLSGVDEIIGDEKFWEGLTTKVEDDSNFADLFNAKSHKYGAMNLIKKVWCSWRDSNYLNGKVDISEKDIQDALHFKSIEETVEEGDKYFAVIAMDGDQMGKWMSGEKLPSLKDNCSPKAKDYLEKIGVDKSVKRLMTPSYHLQFSEALSNFSIYSVREIVEKHGGVLVYSGGDDVLAYVPAKKAIACAKEIRNAFRKDFDKGRIYPGQKCDMSCGIAFGHFKAPLQMLVKEAQRMESIAKNTYGRSALALALYKRSGEIIEWGTKWDSPSIDLMEKVRVYMEDKSKGGEEKISKRFPYAIAQALHHFDLKGENAVMLDVIRCEIEMIVDRQGKDLNESERSNLLAHINKYLDSTSSRLQDFVNLFLTVAFINRERNDDANA